jgi:hypothetical protein
MGWPHLDNTAKTEVGVVEDPPDQVRAVECGGGTGGWWVGDRKWGKIRRGEVKEWEGKVCKGEGDAFKTCGDNINSVTTVVSEGRAKVVGTVSVWIPRETVVGAVESKT